MRGAIAFVVVVAAGCGSKDSAPPAKAADAGLEVIDPGLEPRAPLRYQLAKGTRSELEVTGEVELGSGTERAPWPTLVTTSEVGADDVAPDGTMQIHYTVHSATATDRPNQMVTAEQMSAPLQLLVGTSIRGSLSPSGVLSGLAVDTGGKQLPPALGTQVSVLTRALERMVMPLPDTPIGTGAQWTFKQPLDQTGMKLLASSTIKATAIAPTTLTIVLTSTISGPSQDTTAAGPKVALSHITGTMRGTGTIDLTKLVFAGELVADLQMDMTADGQTEHTAMTTTLRFKQIEAPPAQGAQNAP